MVATKSDFAQSYTEMKGGDVEAIGAHCQMEYCHVLDFLPFPCQSCKGTYCLDHRSETAHKCSNAGGWARKQYEKEQQKNTVSGEQLPSKQKQQCAGVSCKTLVATSLMPASHCSTCNRSYCLKHRMQENHDCKNLTPIGARPSNLIQQQRERGTNALAKLKAWAAKKREEDAKLLKEKTGFFGLGKKTNSAAADLIKRQAQMKKDAKGVSSIPQDKRVYLYVEASADTTKAKFPTGTFFYNKDWTVGRVLDMAAKALQVENVNNRGGGEEAMLRVFHVQEGRLLKFNEKIGDACVTGNMIVLLRGVGSGDLDLIDL